MWRTLLKRLNVDCKRFVALQRVKLVKLLIEDYVAVDSVESALKTIINLQPMIFTPLLVNRVIKTLKKIGSNKVTRDEYFIFLTPEGELFDKSILSG